VVSHGICDFVEEFGYILVGLVLHVVQDLLN
jgi:hypothetical protein